MLAHALFTILFYWYIGFNIGMFWIWCWVFTEEIEEEGLKLKHVILNILFPLTILTYPFVFIINRIVGFFTNDNVVEILNKRVDRRN